MIQFNYIKVQCFGSIQRYNYKCTVTVIIGRWSLMTINADFLTKLTRKLALKLLLLMTYCSFEALCSGSYALLGYNSIFFYQIDFHSLGKVYSSP